MELSEIWLVENVSDEKYLEHLKKLYPNHALKTLLHLNIDLRLLYLKHIFMIENSLKHMLLHQMFINQGQNIKSNQFLNVEHLKNLRTARRLIRAGYHKYTRNGVLKSKTTRSLIEVMSFEAIMNLLNTLNDDNLNKIANYFDIFEHNNRNILLEQLNYLKDIRNYLSHNFKVLGVYFSQKHKTGNYQQEFNANNDHHYLHLVINRFSSKNKLLANFSDEYSKLFKSYNANFNESINDVISVTNNDGTE